MSTEKFTESGPPTFPCRSDPQRHRAFSSRPAGSCLTCCRNLSMTLEAVHFLRDEQRERRVAQAAATQHKRSRTKSDESERLTETETEAQGQMREGEGEPGGGGGGEGD
eukprot:747448-Hanusia_phi.AAC.4